MSELQTEREYLIGLGLAKPGRGRFGRIANEALRIAREEKGIVFADAKAKKAAASVKKERTVVTASAPVNKEPVREEDKQWGTDSSGITVCLADCANGHPVRYCLCVDGPRLPKWLGGGQGSLTRPVAA